jgi:phosphatidylethanolamine/phosphatidyl-N-methylethanolamine N-methyltransferase
MQESSTRKIYDVHSLFYDATFGRLVRRRIARAISHMNPKKDDLVLDLGIGTGVSLNFYPQDRAKVIGVDLSSGMLREARKKIRAQGRDNAFVFQADAMCLPFEDNTFDHVFISHVISVVSDPYRLVREAQRVAKPEARIVIVNHFQSTNRFLAMLEKWLCPLCTKLGWRSDLALQDLVRRTGAEIEYRFKLESIDLWETVVMTNNKSALQYTAARQTVAA